MHKYFCTRAEKDYCARVRLFQEYFKKPATELGEQEIREYLYYLANDKQLNPSTVNLSNSALRFLDDVVLEQNPNYKRIPRQKKTIIF